MPVNAPPEYFKAQSRYNEAKTMDEKIDALEEMLRFLPKHKGTENVQAQLRAKIAKLRKQGERKSGRSKGVTKEGEAQVCILGFTNSGKSTLIAKLTNAKPKISEHAYTTVEPFVGMMDYKGLKIQLVEIPATFERKYLSIAKSADAIIFCYKEPKDKKILLKEKEKHFIRVNHIFVTSDENNRKIKEKIWGMLDLIIIYTKSRKKGISDKPMALPRGSNVKAFAGRVHKDFVKNFRFARIRRGNRIYQVGLDYKLKNGDVVELFME
jgi:hypothetical protein